MTEITFATEPSYTKQNKNTLNFYVQGIPEQNIDALANALPGDILSLKEGKFLITMKPLVHWSRAEKRVTQAIVIGGWSTEKMVEKIINSDQYRIFTKPGCSYCDRAKQLLDQKEIQYAEIIVDNGQVPRHPSKEYITVDQFRALIPDVRTVPQIFKNDTLIGGFDALQALMK
jgi:glutaredoxin